VKNLVTVIVGYRDKVSISENLGLIDAQPLGDLAGVLLGLSIVFAGMTHPVMCRRTADQVKEISGHAGATATGDARSNRSGSSDVSDNPLTVVGSEATKFSTTCCERIENVLGIHSLIAVCSASTSRAGWHKRSPHIPRRDIDHHRNCSIVRAGVQGRLPWNSRMHAESGVMVSARRDAPCERKLYRDLSSDR
jgi:hypothetical protein